MTTNTKLNGKTAVVTGAAQGIGHAIAQALGEWGARVIVADVRNAAEAAEKLRALGIDAVGATLDVAEESSWLALASTLSDGLDILVNNAGLYATLSRVPFEQLSNEEWRRVFDVNVHSIFIGAKALVPLMRKRGGGAIVNISSASVYKGPANLMHYVTGKGAVTMMTQVMARELGADNIRVNSIAPGFTLSDGVLNRDDPIQWQRDMNNAARAIKRDQTPQDISGAVRFLCSDDATFITGQGLVVDGGIVFH
jgi:NAD(P)-dependent dehydrogenase (short-subunit alcohol dehydrogenase family)